MDRMMLTNKVSALATIQIQSPLMKYLFPIKNNWIQSPLMKYLVQFLIRKVDSIFYTISLFWINSIKMFGCLVHVSSIPFSVSAFFKRSS